MVDTTDVLRFVSSLRKCSESRADVSSFYIGIMDRNSWSIYIEQTILYFNGFSLNK